MVNLFRKITDKIFMQLNETIEIVKQVVLDPRIIGTFIVLLLYMGIVNYVVHYRKKPPKVRKIKTPKKTAAASAPEEGGNSQDGEEASETPSEGE